MIKIERKSVNDKIEKLNQEIQQKFKSKEATLQDVREKINEATE